MSGGKNTHKLEPQSTSWSPWWAETHFGSCCPDLGVRVSVPKLGSHHGVNHTHTRFLNFLFFLFFLISFLDCSLPVYRNTTVLLLILCPAEFVKIVLTVFCKIF